MDRFPVRFLVAVLLVVLGACSRQVPVSTVLDDVSGLRPGDPVMLEGQQIGAVTSIEAEALVPGLVVSFELGPDRASQVQANAVAYVPLASPPTLTLINPAEPAEPVLRGARLKGLSPLEVTVWRAGDALESAADLIGHLGQQLEAYFGSEEWAQKQAEIDAELDALATESERAAESIADELDELFESLGKRRPPADTEQREPPVRSEPEAAIEAD